MKAAKVALLAAVVVLLPTPLAAAPEATGASCAVNSKVILDPGISMKGSKGTFESRGGKVGCVGVMKNRPVAGLGKLSFAGTYGPRDNCEHGKGKGSAVAVVPKAAGGTIKVSGNFKFTRVGSAVVVTGSLGGARLVGNLQFLPKTGQDCVNRKVTRATVTGVAAVGAASIYYD